MNLKQTIFGIGVIALLGGSLTLVSAQSTDTLTIGVVGDDETAYQAAVLAAEEINAGDDDDIRGVVSSSDDRYNFEIVYYEANTREEAVDALEEAVNDGVVAVLGVGDDSLMEAIAAEGTPDVAVIFTAPDAPEDTRLLRATASYDDWAKAAADYLAEARGYTRIAVVAVDTSTAENAFETFSREAGNDVIVAELTHEVDENNFREIAESIRDADAQALFAWTPNTSMLSLLTELDNIGWDGVVVYAGLDTDFISQASELAEGVIGITGWTPAAYDSASQVFVTDYKARWQSAPNETAAVSYDAVYRIAAAVENSNATVSSIASQLNGSTTFTGVQGEYNGLEIDTLRLVQADANGQLVEAARYDDDECANCPNTWWPENTEDNENGSETFNIGLIAANNGVTETLAENIEQAARMAVREVNEAGGILRSGTRYTLNLQVYTATNSEEAQTAFEQAVEDGVGVVLGPDYNSQVMPNLTLASGSEVVQIVSATSPQIASTESEDYVYQVRATDDALATAAAEYLVNTRALTEFAAVASRTDYGLDAIETFENTVSASDDGRVILRLEHDVDNLDMAPLAEQIANSDAQAVAVWTS